MPANGKVVGLVHPIIDRSRRSEKKTIQRPYLICVSTKKLSGLTNGFSTSLFRFQIFSTGKVEKLPTTSPPLKLWWQHPRDSSCASVPLKMVIRWRRHNSLQKVATYIPLFKSTTGIQHLMFPRVQLGQKKRYCRFAVSPLIQVEIIWCYMRGNPLPGLMKWPNQQLKTCPSLISHPFLPPKYCPTVIHQTSKTPKKKCGKYKKWSIGAESLYIYIYHTYI